MNKKEKETGSERYEEISKHIKKGENVTLLDVGSRDAILRKYLDDSVKYYGIDITPKTDFVLRVDVTKDNFPFKSNFFDYAVASEVLEHLDNPHHCLEEIHRVLKPKGLLIGTVPNCLEFGGILNALFKPNSCDCGYLLAIGEGHVCTHGFKEIRALLMMNNYKVLDIYSFQFQLPRLGAFKILEKVLPRFGVYIFFKAVKQMTGRGFNEK